ncbi:hypothetical protein S4054249_11010 [Pseudoalteromonas luteoviolacea]|uniref:Uncharacterized protein n=1 Tax=Pseudoalteromonas luteoviolacea S4054 TaxID=1129367 RepID=A0A0F6AEP5_9GAMM|nr:hypothetical protein S4054249_11010 [Pseudoalteromonas luteoviolacea]AOT13256.1 hypothetical protein S40542_10985 [Pseudoalteromonas luteoviolacea]AOT18169.1 hypothetical protein S4054_10985 [Pseudoalteromonas luteoviolacea]KKE84286.1 hypothetical protein N479_10325 [Pseudoalteromonas luteoviolacea S4054]KZN76109.1 hypothetical protein N481_07090 [Pseudoalteromonas luteoviolacea S4047-1]
MLFPNYYFYPHPMRWIPIALASCTLFENTLHNQNSDNNLLFTKFHIFFIKSKKAININTQLFTFQTNLSD